MKPSGGGCESGTHSLLWEGRGRKYFIPHHVVHMIPGRSKLDGARYGQELLKKAVSCLC